MGQWGALGYATIHGWTARDIVRSIRAGRFDIMGDFAARYQDDFANICQTRVFGGADDLEAEA